VFGAHLRTEVRRGDLDPDDHGRAGDGEPDGACTDIAAAADSVTESFDPAVANADRCLDAERAGSRSRVVLRGR